MGERLLNLSEYIENVFCIYRNYYLRGIIWKSWIAFRIIVEHIFIFGFGTAWLIHYTHPLSDVIYVFITSFNSVLVVLLAIYHGKSYAAFKGHLNVGYKFFSKDPNYQKNLEAKHSALVGLLVILVLCKLLIFAYSLFYPDEEAHGISWIWQFLIQFNLFVCDMRYMYEFLVLYCFLYVMYEQLNLITRSLKGDMSFLDMETIVHFWGSSQGFTTEVQKWCVGYKHVRRSCKLFNTIFGFQLTFMLTAAILFYIILLYSTASASVSGQLPPLGIVTYIITVILMLYVLFMLSQSAQQMQNSVDVLRRRLCKVLLVSISDKENYQATKDLLKMMNTCPIRLRAFGSFPVDMTLLPTCISFFTSYTVIALQFNNIL